MRVALFTDTYLPHVNGVARTLARLVEHAEARGHDVALVTPRHPGHTSRHRPLHLELPSLTAPFYPELRLSLPLDPWTAKRLEPFSPDLVHVATEFTLGWSGLRWAEEHDVPVVTSFHTDFPAYLAGYGLGGFERVAWAVLRGFHARAHLTYCPSRSTLDKLRANQFHERLRIWSRGVDASHFRPQRRSDTVRRRLAPGAQRIILYVGRLAPEKRLDVLLAAFGRVRAQHHQDTALVIVGDGPAADELRSRAGPGVHFTGYMAGAALADAYAAADIFAFPSDTETFGNVVLEAMASGVPVVAPAAGGVTDSVAHERTGLLVAPQDPVALAAATLRLLIDEELRERLARGARAEALERSWPRILDGLLEGWMEVQEQRRGARVA